MSFSGEFNDKTRKIPWNFRVYRLNVARVFSRLSRIAPYHDLRGVFCTAFRVSSYWDLRNLVEKGETSRYCQEHEFSLRGMNTHGTAKFEGDLRLSSTNIRKTITRLPWSSWVSLVESRRRQKPISPRHHDFGVSFDSEAPVFGSDFSC